MSCAAVFSLFSFLGASCTPAPELTTVELSLARVPSCALGKPDTLSVRALGDFPGEVAILDPARPTLTLDRFPVDSQALVFDAELGKVHAGAVVPLRAASGARSSWLLPDAKSCPLGDPSALALPGAALVALADGGLLIAGGQDDSALSVSSALVLREGAQLVEQVQDGMLLRRAFATATTALGLENGLVVIAGGNADNLGSAHDTYEVFDAHRSIFARERSGKLLTGPRMQHAAAQLLDGRLLLLGGRAEPSGPALASAELLDVAGAHGEAARGDLAVARVSPRLLVLDNGVVLVLAGSDSAGKPVSKVERFDPVSTRFRTLAHSPTAHAEQVFAALPGGRVASVGCDVPGSAAVGCTLGLLLTASDATDEPDWHDVPIDFSSQAPEGLRKLRLLPLGDGRLLLTGEDPSAAIARRAFVIDPVAGTLTHHDSSRVPSEVSQLADGTIAELDAFGASLRREVTQSSYDTPSGNLVQEPFAFLARDLAEHWQNTASELRAEADGARVDVAQLRFADTTITIAADGGVTLLLASARGEEVAVETDGAAGLLVKACGGALASDARMVVTRRGRTLRIAKSDGTVLCTRAIFEGPLSVAIRAASGTRIRELRLARL